MSEEFRPVIEDEIYSEWTDEAPVFLKADVLKLRDFIHRYITAKSADNQLLYKIDYGISYSNNRRSCHTRVSRSGMGN